MQNMIDTALNEWRTLEVPLVIWGGWNLLAGKVSRWLDEHEIAWETYAVNWEYYNEKAAQNRTVILEEYLKVNRCAIIVAFRGYNISMLDGLNKKNIVKVYAFDFQGRYASGYDTMISEEYLLSKSKELELLRSHLADENSKNALNVFIHQKMYSEYEKPYSRTRQYFEDGIIEFGEKEVFVDCGGFDGEDTFFFLKRMRGKNGKAYIFEPDLMNYNEIKRRFRDDSKVIVYNLGISDHHDKVCFESGKGSGSRISAEGTATIDVDTLDNVVGKKKVTFLKMDIEGAELQALRGAEEMIKRCRPKMAICVYHRREDIFTIPQYILSIHSDYKFYIRNYHPASTETVLYAV